MKLLFCACLLVFIVFAGDSQSNSNKLVPEIGVSVSVMNCSTDLGGKAIATDNFKPGGGIYAGLLYKGFAGLRLEATLGQVAASDRKANKVSTKMRNLSFKSNINEVSLLLEIHPLNIKFRPGAMPAISPYLLAGVGFFSFNPKANLNGQWISLQPLHTEGEGFAETGRPDYKLTQINIPVGGGIQYKLSNLFSLRGEAIYRILNTDYLDDVSTAYIDPVLFDKYLPAAKAAIAKQLADRRVEIPENSGQIAGVGRGHKNRDAYYSLNIKLSVSLGKGYKNYSACYTF